MKITSHICTAVLLASAMTNSGNAVATDKQEMLSKDKLLAVSMLYGGTLILGDIVPEAFDRINLPSDLKPFARTEYGEGYVRLAIVNGTPAEELSQELVGLLSADGWQRPISIGHSMASKGFVPPSVVKRPANNNYCHPKIGTLSYLFEEGESGSVGWIRLVSRQRGSGVHSACTNSESSPGTIIQPMSGTSALVSDLSGTGVKNYLPILVLPDDVTGGLQGGSGFHGSSEVTTTTTIKTKLGLSELVDHFADQLDFQGWSTDASWSGRRSGGSVWELEVEDDKMLIGILTLVIKPDGKYWAQFRLMS